MTRIASALLGLGFVVALTGAAQATPFTGTYAVSANGGSDGLQIGTSNDLSNPFTINLNVGAPHTVQLFDIWTTETAVNGDDTAPKSISVSFSFTLPAPAFGGTQGGDTTGEHHVVAGFIDLQNGRVTWDAPLVLAFGPNNDGMLRITLSDETFNSGVFGLLPGARFGAHVDATFTEVTAASVAVSEPETLALFGSMLLGLSILPRRRRPPSNRP